MRGKPKAGKKVATSEGLTYREIAKRLGFANSGSVIWIERRALAKMRADLERLRREGWRE